MNASSSPAAPSASPSERWRARAAVLAIVAVLVLSLLLATSALAQESDDTPPTLAGGERVNATTMQVTVADDTDVDEASIDVEDFSLSDGDLASINVTESGSNATVKLFLESGVNTDTVTVRSPADGAVTDAAGNALASDSVTVTGMDSRLPFLREFRLKRVNESAAKIVARSNEPLTGLDVEIRGPTSANLTRADFRAVDDNVFGVPHVRTVHFPEDGVYTVEVTSLEDESGLFVNLTTAETFVRDATAPTTEIDGPSHVEAGDRARFDGSASTDNVGVVDYEWTVDGETLANGSGFEHAFDEPGTHRVGLTVADEGGNADTANWSVTVHDAPSKRGVGVTATNDSARRLVVVSSNRTEERVRITDEYGRLVGDDDVTVRSLRVTLPTDETLRLNVCGNATAPGFEDGTGREALTVVSIDHGNETVRDPTFRFSVSASRLSRAGISYSDVALYRDDGNWTELPTEVVRATKSTVVYEAESPGLSTFVVGASGAERDWEASDGGDGGDIRVADARLVRDSVPLGEYVVVEVTLANDGIERGSFLAGLSVGSRVVDTRRVTVDAGETRSVSFATRAVSNGTVSVNGTVAGDLRVVTRDETPTEESGGGLLSNDGNDTGEEANGSENSGDGGGFDVPIPNPLALWPDGLVGTVLTGIVGLVVGTYGVLKALAIYLGY
ncbi:PGF-pre-PGF domain-containing protein [Halomicrobium zhouii]|uniref:PGF-pre-PGF domain-containing protein n=1 Tax=Halomicrobium zhouii TaxID=767519 RepID=A0A1I6LD75_9EURY|nr:PKD domain-containing protein [Halomicrobium zhouii]SFS01383.1 PGF-pre-PGF domain-containing protein [Halomicrobium zhouii]